MKEKVIDGVKIYHLEFNDSESTNNRDINQINKVVVN